MRRAPALLAPLLVLALASACGSSSDGDGGDAGGTSAPAATTTEPTYEGLEAAAITFHPVLQILACDGGVPGASDTTDAPAATPSSTVPAVDGTLCYELGPAGGDGSDVRDAKVYADGVGIEVKVREEAVEDLDEVFDACFEAADTCPAASTDGQGYVAIVVDGRVVSTPAITEEDLASSPFVITGDFDKAQATNIAAAINGT